MVPHFWSIPKWSTLSNLALRPKSAILTDETSFLFFSRIFSVLRSLWMRLHPWMYCRPSRMPFMRLLASKSEKFPSLSSIRLLSSPPGNSSMARNSLVSVSLTWELVMPLHGWILLYFCDWETWGYLPPFWDSITWYVKPCSCRLSSYWFYPTFTASASSSYRSNTSTTFPNAPVPSSLL